MERVLITGGTGFLGRATVRRLLDTGYAVRVLTRGPWPFEQHPRLERVNGGMTNAQSLRDAVAECDIVVHLAARKNDERDSEAVNVDGTRVLCDVAKRAGVTRIVYVSTQSAALARRGAYGETKLRGEHVVRSCGVPFVIMRPSLVYGEGDAGVFATIEKLSRLPFVPVFGDGRAVFRPIHVDDVAEAIVATIDQKDALGTTLDLGGPDALSFNDLIRRVQDSKGIRRRIVHLPVWIGLFGASILRILPQPPVTRSNVLGGLATPTMDVQKTCDVLHVAPRPFALAAIDIDADAAVILSYVSSGAVTPTAELTQRFRAACAVHGIARLRAPPRLILPYIDAASRLWRPRSDFRRSLIVAAAITECTPEGGLVLLPRTSRLTALCFRVAFLSISAAWYMIVGSLLWIIPSVRRHAS